MSKTKKIISMLLAIAMVLTVAPTSVLASAAESVTYGNVTFAANEFTVDTSATTEVIRVSAGPGSFSLGTSVVPATPSGIPKSSGTFASVGYGGETPEIPTLRFTIKGAKLDEVPRPTATGAQLTIDAGKIVSENTTTKTYVYEWEISAGTAEAGANVVYEIKYKISGKEYIANAFSHVEDILIMNGFMSTKAKKTNDTGSVNARHSLIVQFQSHNMYSQMCPDSSVNNRVVGYINYASETRNGGALMGCGNNADLSSESSAYGSAAPNNSITGQEVPALIKSYTESSGSNYNMCYHNDTNRGQPRIYLDTGSGDTFRDINFRMTLQNAESDMFTDARVASINFYSGKQTFDDRDDPPASTLSSSIMNVSNQNAGSNRANSISGGDMTQYIMFELAGTGPATAAAGDTGTPTYYSAAVNFISNEGGNTSDGSGGINFEVYTYDKRDLRGVIEGIDRGSGTYTLQSNAYAHLGACTFDKGAHPQSSSFTGGWSEFESAYKTAYGVLVKPDTNQKEIDDAALALWNAYAGNADAGYTGLTGYNPRVEVVVKHVDVTTGAEIAPRQYYTDAASVTNGVIKGAAQAAGTVVTANIATIEGYDPSGEQVKTDTLSGASSSQTITFNYKPKSYNVIAYTNNDNNDQGIHPFAYNTTVDVDSIPYGTKANFTFVGDLPYLIDANGEIVYDESGNPKANTLTGWYSDNGAWTQPVTDFTMGSSNKIIYGRWVTTPIEVYAIPVVDGQQLAEQKLGEISPKTDSVVRFTRPADLDLEGYLFVEYYADAELTTPVTWPLEFNLGDPLKHTVYARMVDVNGKIVFESNGGTAVNDQPFTINSPVNAPAAPTKTGYQFVQWHYNRDLNDPVTWPVTRPSATGFIAYAEWDAQPVKIEFNLDDPTSKFDTVEIPYISGDAETEISSEDYPPVPKKYGYVFDHWVDDATGQPFEFKAGVKYGTTDIKLNPIWRGTSYSAFIGLDSYEKLSGQYVETYAPVTNEDGAKVQVGDTVTVRMTSQTNFYVGSTAFVFMYDHNFFELVGVDAAAFTLNENNEYVSGIDAKIQGVTNLSTENWPDSQKSQSGQYTAMLLTIDPTVTSTNYNTEPMSDGEWLVEFQFKIKDTASGSGTVYMSNDWTRNADNPMGTMFYGWSENSSSVIDTYNNVVTPDLDTATATVYLDETQPVDVKIYADPNGGTWSDGTTAVKTFEGREETEIEGYVAPTRDGYTLTVGTDNMTVWTTEDGSDSWAEGYYGKVSQQEKTFLAQWTPNIYTISYYKDLPAEDGTEVLHWSTTGEYEQAYAAPPANPSKTGYDFGGWVDINGNAAPATTPLDGIKLYPKWNPKDVGFTLVVHYTPATSTTGQPTTSRTPMSGLTGQRVEIVNEIPSNQTDNTIYILTSDLPAIVNGNYIYDASANTLPIVAESIAADGSTTVDVYYKAKEINVIFDANGGAWANGDTRVIQPSSYLQLIRNSIPATNPVKEGMDFAGWFANTAGTGAELTSASSNRLQTETTYYAKWTAAKVPVTFDANGGYFDNDPSVTTKSGEVAYGSEIKELAQPKRDGYDFLGWATTSTATSTEPLGTMDTLDENGKTFYAVYKLHDYTVTFVVTYTDSGEEYSSVSDTAVNMGEIVTVPAAPAVDGYTFDGWTKGGAAIAAGSTFEMPAGDVTVEGTLSPITYTATFDGTGGYFNGDTAVLSVDVDAVYNAGVTKPANPSRQGYEFLGWTMTEGSSDTVNVDSYVHTTADNVTFYAVWNALFAKYTIETYYMDINGQYSDTPDDTNKSNQGTVGEPVSTSHTTVTGFTADLGKSILEDVVAADGSTVLKIYYIRNQYTLYTNVQGDVKPAATYYYEESVTEPAAPIVEGYNFNGWTPSAPATMPANDVTLIADLSLAKFHVAFYTDSTMTSVVSEGDYDYMMAIVAPTATKTGHSFVSWIDAETGNSVDFANTTVTTPAKAVNYYATWKINQYTITFGNTGDSEYEDITLNYGADIPDVEDPVRAGYTFQGWNPSIPETMPAPDNGTVTRINATWKINTYTVTFDAAGGKVVNPTDYTEGDTYVVTDSYGADVLAPSDEPTRTGYTFDGWDKEIPATVPAENVTITAKWTINQYTITFANTGDTTIAPITQDYDTAVTAPGTPSREGYTWNGWDKEIPAKMPAENITITGKWTVNQYTITFANTGDTTIAPITQDYGTAVTAPGTPSREGYTWNGWDKDIPATMPAENITINGQWTINQYTITFDTAGGSDVAPITQDYGTAVTAPADPTKTGYSFDGWDKQVPATMPAENVTITAKWTVNQYTITFNTDGGSAVADIKQDYNTTVTLPAAPAKEGSTFTGWQRADGTVLEAGATFSMPAANETVTALWDVNVYTLTWVVDDAETPVEYAYGADVETLADPAKTGYTFTGWDTEVPATMPAKDLTITAQFKINQYTITFANTGDTKIDPITQDYGTAVTAPGKPVKDGYTWGGWDKEIPATMPAENITITGSWTINQYTVTFLDAEGNAFGEILTLDFGTEIEAPAEAPEKEFYTFAGWSLDGVNATDDLGTVPSKNIEIVSLFTKDTVTLVLKTEKTAKIHEGGIKETGKNNNENALLKGYIVGLETRLRAADLDNYLAVEGDGRLEYVLTKYKVAGTGAVVNVYDRNDTPDNTADDVLVEQYIIVIYGDVNGDASIDATDYSIVTDESLGASAWSAYNQADADNGVENANANYDHAMTLAADLNKDGRVNAVDATGVEEVSLYVAEINQQTGEVTPY